MLIGSYVVLNLFLAVLLNAFNADEMKKKTEEDSKLTKRMRNIKRWFKAKFKACCRKKKVADENGDANNVETENNFNEDDEFKVTKGVRINAPDSESDTDTKSKTGARSRTYSLARSDATRRQSTASNETESKVTDCCWPFCDKHLRCCFRHWDPEEKMGMSLLNIRNRAMQIASNKVFEWTILAFIFASSFSLCLQDANLDEKSDMGIVLAYMDYGYLAIFTIEFMIKLTALGVRVYFTSFWTLLDFTIVSTGFIDILMAEMASGVNLSALRALRTLRALRPLRMVSRWQGMKIVVNALITAIPGIINVLTVVMIIWLIFAIMGVQFFAGKFWFCKDIESGNRTAVQLTPDRATCETRPGEWQCKYFLSPSFKCRTFVSIFYFLVNRVLLLCQFRQCCQCFDGPVSNGVFRRLDQHLPIVSRLPQCNRGTACP